MKAALRIGLLAALAAAAQVGCRGSAMTGNDGGGDGSPTGDVRNDVRNNADGTTNQDGGGMDGSINPDGSSGGTYSLADITNETAANHPAPGSLVTVSGNLVVLSPRGIVSVSTTSMNCLYAMWVGTEEGGPYSGIEVIHRVQGMPDDTGRIQCPDDTVIPNAMIGDKITALAGTYTEFCSGHDIDGGTETCPPGTTFAEMEVDTLTTSGTGMLPPPNVVTDFSTINGVDQMPGSSDEAFENTLVEVDNVDVVSAPDSNKNFVVAPHGMTSPQLSVSYRSFSGLGCLTSGLPVGTQLTSVKGMLEFNFGVWKIHVRQPSDVSTVAGCSGTDGGMADGGNAGDLTIQDLQDETSASHPSPGAMANLTGNLVALTPRGIISASASSGNCLYGAWVGDSAGGDYSGILVTHSIAGTVSGSMVTCPDDTVIPSTLMPGTAIIGLTGVYREFCGTSPCPPNGTSAEFDATQLAVGATATLPAPTVVADLTTINGTTTMPASQDNALQGTLIEVQNVDVVSAPDTNKNFVVAPHGATTPALTVSLRQFQGLGCLIPTLTPGTQLTSITGVLELNFGVWKLHVRQPSDVQGVTCATDGGAGPG